MSEVLKQTAIIKIVKDLQEIARNELARRRRRLGQLTPEQERAVESLLMSMVAKISHPLIQQMRRSDEAAGIVKLRTELAALRSSTKAWSSEKTSIAVKDQE